MTFVDRLWLRLPVVGRAVLIGVAAAAAAARGIDDSGTELDERRTRRASLT
jgi:hypothetical protein